MRAEARELDAAARAEAASWVDTDKHACAKQERARAKDLKADAKLAARTQRQELATLEEAANANLRGANKGISSAVTKVTQAEIARRQALMASTVGKAGSKKLAKTQVVPQPKLEANHNHDHGFVQASGVDGALAALEGVPGGCTTSFAAFERRMLACLCEEKPGLKQSQLRDHVLKAWSRSPENPKNGVR